MPRTELLNEWVPPLQGSEVTPTTTVSKFFLNKTPTSPSKGCNGNNQPTKEVIMFDPNKFPALSSYLPAMKTTHERFVRSKIYDMSLETAHSVLLDLEKSADRNKYLYLHDDAFVGSSKTSWKGIERAFNESFETIQTGLRADKTYFVRNVGYYGINRIVELYCLFSEEAIEARKEWVDEWQENYSSKYKKAIEYLTSTTRWGNSVSYNFNQRKEFFRSGAAPLLNEYRREMFNNYKIAEGYLAKPKYKLGDLVELRSAYSNSFHLKIFNLEGYEVPWSTQSKLKQMQTSRRGFLTIIEVDPRVPLGYRKGNKLYKVILAGETQPFMVEESLIKKIRGIKKKKKGDK